MNMKVLSNVVGALGMVPKNMENGIGTMMIRWMIETQALLKSARYLEESGKSEETCDQSDSRKKPSV